MRSLPRERSLRPRSWRGPNRTSPSRLGRCRAARRARRTRPSAWRSPKAPPAATRWRWSPTGWPRSPAGEWSFATSRETAWAAPSCLGRCRPRTVPSTTRRGRSTKAPISRRRAGAARSRASVAWDGAGRAWREGAYAPAVSVEGAVAYVEDLDGAYRGDVANPSRIVVVEPDGTSVPWTRGADVTYVTAAWAGSTLLAYTVGEGEHLSVL